MKILNLSYVHGPNIPGHEVIHRDVSEFKKIGWPAAIEEVKDLAPDLIIEREWNDHLALYEPLYEALPGIKKAWWWIDSHVNFEYRLPYAKQFDYLYLAVSRYVEPARDRLGHDRVGWLPNCWSHGEVIPNNDPKDFEVSFVCRWKPENLFVNRIACIEKLKSHFGPRVNVINSGDMINIVRRSCVSMNNCFDNDLNFRYFEVLGCGTELVTNPCDDLFKVEGMSDRVTIYHDLDEMITLTEDILAGKIKHDMHEIQHWIADKHDILNRYQTIIRSSK